MYIAHQTQNQTTASNHINIIHKIQAKTAWFIGVTISELFVIFKLIVFKIFIIWGFSAQIYQLKINKQNNTKLESINQILQANLFWTDQTHIFSDFFIKGLTIAQKIEKSGDIKTFKTKSYY